MRHALLFICLLECIPALASPSAPQPVTIAAEDGLLLRGRFYQADHLAPAVLLFHQCDRDTAATGYEALAPRLQALGLNALVVDLRGYGGSVSDTVTAQNWQRNQQHFAADAEAVLAYLLGREETRDDAVAVVGASCGGRVATGLALAHREVSSLVLISGALGGSPDTLARGLSDRALFCIVGEDDPFGAVVSSARTMFGASTNPASRLQLYRVSDHGTPLFRHDPRLVDEIVEWLASRLRDVPPTGVFQVAGARRSPGDGGDARQAPLAFPLGLARDGSGNLFVVERTANRIRKVEAGTGTITTVAGDGERGYAGDGGPATEARLSAPNNIVVDKAGNLIFSDTFNQRLRRIDGRTGIIETIAGTGEAGFSGDGGPARLAQLHGPYGLALDRAGNLYFADTDGNRIRRIDAATGTIRTVAGSGERGYAGDGGPAAAASFARPHVLAVDRFGNLIVGDSYNQRIRRVHARDATIETIAGSGETGSSPVGTPALQAKLGYFGKLIARAGGDLVFTEWVNNRIVRIADGKLELLQGAEGPLENLPGPAGMVFDEDGNLYWVEAKAWDRSGRVRRLDRRTGRVSHVAGSKPE